MFQIINQKNLKITFFILLVIITILSLLPVNSNLDLGNKDKIGHLIAYFTLTTNAMLLKNFYAKKNIILSMIIAYGFTIELLQGFVPGRDTSFIDGIFNSIGVILGLFFAILMRRYIKIY
jgi:VanZ family protein